MQKTRPAKIAITPVMVTTYEEYFLFIFLIFLWLRLDSASQIDDNTSIRNNHKHERNTMRIKTRGLTVGSIMASGEKVIGTNKEDHYYTGKPVLRVVLSKEVDGGYKNRVAYWNLSGTVFVKQLATCFA